MKSPEFMKTIVVRRDNYPEIVEASKGSKEPYSYDDLDRIASIAKARNTIAIIAFFDSSIWEGYDWGAIKGGNEQ